MKRKGISPLIAAVLLIAFTMAVASLFAQWAPQLIQGAQRDTSNTTQELQRCTGLNIDVVQSDFSSDVASITVQQTAGNQGIGSLSVTWFYSDSTGAVQNSTGITIDSPRGTATIKRNEGSGTEPIDEVRISPTNCQGAAPITYTP
ncbi:MAG: archaellin/type IV pilin N-terminal domain-containing protein [Candidatus Nanohaloarchaea archaeon]